MGLAGERGLDEFARDDPAVLDGVDHGVGLADAVGRRLRVERRQLEPRGVADGERRHLAAQFHVDGEDDEALGHDPTAEAGVLAVAQGHGEREFVHALRLLHRLHLGKEPLGVADRRGQRLREVQEGPALGRDIHLEIHGRGHDLEGLPGAVQAGVEQSLELEVLEGNGRREGLLGPVRRDPVAVLLGVANHDDLHGHSPSPSILC